MRTKVLIYCCFFLFLASANRVQGVEGFWRGEVPNFTVRKAQAEKWLSDFKLLEKQIPTLSPSEEAWLHRELAGEILTSRALLAMDSKEFHIKRSRRLIEKLITALSSISENKLQDKKQEVLFWAITANTIMNYGLWQSVHVLINEGIVDKNTRGIENFINEDSGYLNIVLQAETIMDRVVIQYLNDTLPAN